MPNTHYTKTSKLIIFFFQFQTTRPHFQLKLFSLSSQTLSLSGLEILVWYGLERERLRLVWSELEEDVETDCHHSMASGGMWVQDQPNGEWFKNCGGWVLGFKVILVVQTSLEKQGRSHFPSPLKCTASVVLRLKKCEFGDVGFDVLGVVVFVPPIFLLWPMFSVNFMGLF